MTTEKKTTDTADLQTAYTPDAQQANVLAVGRGIASAPRYAANFNLSTGDGKARMLASVGEGDLRASDLDGEVFEMVYWLVSQGTFVNEETGDEQTGPRICLWDKGGRMMVCAAWSIARYVQAIIDIHGPGPYDPPIGLQIINTVRRDGKRSYKVTVIDL